MTFTITQGDTAPPIQSTLTDTGVPVDLRNASNVFFHVEDKFNRSVISDDLTGRVSYVDKTLGKVKYVWKSENTSDVGKYTAEWEVLYDDGKRETFPSDRKIEIEIVGGIE